MYIPTRNSLMSPIHTVHAYIYTCIHTVPPYIHLYMYMYMHKHDNFVSNICLFFVELVTDEDIQLISESLGASWRDLGEILGFSSPELNVIEATSSTSMGESSPPAGDSPPLKHSQPKRHSAPIPLTRLSSTSSRIMKKLRQSVFSTADLLFSSELPPAHRMLLHWQRDNGNQATLSCLISALEIIQRRDIADCLIESRIDGPGFVI